MVGPPKDAQRQFRDVDAEKLNQFRSFLTDNPDKARIRSGISRGKRG